MNNTPIWNNSCKETVKYWLNFHQYDASAGGYEQAHGRDIISVKSQMEIPVLSRRGQLNADQEAVAQRQKLRWG